MAELTRVLRPGGTMMIAVPAYQWAWSDHDVANGHHRRYTRRRLSRVDTRALPKRNLPFGPSIFAVAVKPLGRMCHA